MMITYIFLFPKHVLHFLPSSFCPLQPQCPPLEPLILSSLLVKILFIVFPWPDWTPVRVGPLYSDLGFLQLLAKLLSHGQGVAHACLLVYWLISIFHCRKKFTSVTISNGQKIHLPCKYLLPKRQTHATVTRSRARESSDKLCCIFTFTIAIELFQYFIYYHT